MKHTLVTCICLLIFLANCTAKKETSKTEQTTEEKSKTEQILKAGYIKATVIDKTKDECGFVLKSNSTGKFFLPNNMEESFKKDGLQVWLKYRPIRPAQSCKVGSPITIEEIKIIE